MPEATIATGKAARKSLMLFYKPKGASPTYELIGKGIEEASISQSANIETVRDIIGNTETTLDYYEKTTDLDPIYLVGGNKFSERLDEIEEKEQTLDDVRETFLVVKAYKSNAGKFTAWEQDAVIELTEFGGDTKGVNLPCTLHWVGERTYGTFDPSTKEFTAETGAE